MFDLTQMERGDGFSLAIAARRSGLELNGCQFPVLFLNSRELFIVRELSMTVPLPI